MNQESPLNEQLQMPKNPTALLDDIVVAKADNCAEKVRKYVCGIKRPARPAPNMPHEEERFEFQIRVGPACFTTETFKWDGVGEHAKQVFRNGAIQSLSEIQVQEIREKLKHRYIRRVRDKTGNLVGVIDIDASDGGGLDPVTGQRTPAKRLNGRLSGDETPLKDLLVFEPIYENEMLGGRTVTVADLKSMLLEAEQDEQRILEGDDAVFETGRGGKKQQKTAERDPKLAASMSTTDGKRKADGGFLPG